MSRWSLALAVCVVAIPVLVGSLQAAFESGVFKTVAGATVQEWGDGVERGGAIGGGGAAFDEEFAFIRIEAEAVRLVECDGAAIGEVEGFHEASGLGVEDFGFVGAVHGGDECGGEDADKDDDHHEFQQREAVGRGWVVEGVVVHYQFPISAPSPSPPSRRSAPRDQRSKLVG
jgi:hypothetical protein